MGKFILLFTRKIFFHIYLAYAYLIRIFRIKLNEKKNEIPNAQRQNKKIRSNQSLAKVKFESIQITSSIKQIDSDALLFFSRHNRNRVNLFSRCNKMSFSFQFEFHSDCDVNCHKKCQKLTANLCGVNQKLIVEALSSVRRGIKFNET